MAVEQQSVPDGWEVVSTPKPAGVPDGWEVVSAQKPIEPSFVPKTAAEFVSRMGRAALDVPIGAAKNIGRAVQMVPGFAEGTDQLFGLPEGASRQAMQPSNPTQTVGGYVGDAALIAATAGAEAGPAMLSRSAGYISNPTVGERAIELARPAAKFGSDTVAAITKRLASSGPVTPDKVAKMIVEHGKDAVKLGIIGLGGAAGYEAWRAVRHLF